MFLRELRISGFKSFAGKVHLELSPGTTAVVGPNGSGKSNIADAIRWVLGEQSSGKLRLKKNEEVIFAGTAKRPRGSMAEVSLLLDNTDGSVPLEFSEIQITRKLYRSGESEYQLNGRKTKLQEIQQLLAAAGFGANSYAVIGQGTIDNLILATPAERKLLFDEASGIRQYDLKREQAVRKLQSTQDNLAQAKNILAELEPRLKILQRAAANAQGRQELTDKLTETRRSLVLGGNTFYSQAAGKTKNQLQQLKIDINQAESEILELEDSRQKLETAQRQSASRSQQASEKLRRLELDRDELTNKLTVKQAELSHLLEPLNLAADLDLLEKALTARKAEVKANQKHLQQLRQSEASSAADLEKLTLRVKKSQLSLTKLRRLMSQTSQNEFISHALAIIKQLSRDLANQDFDPEAVKLMIYKAGRLLSNASGPDQTEMVVKLKQLQEELGDLMNLREKAQNAHTDAVLKVRGVELDIKHAEQAIESSEAELATSRQAVIDREQTRLLAEARYKKDIAGLDHKLAKTNQSIQIVRGSLSPAVNAEDIFSLARQLEERGSHCSRLKAELTQLQSDSEAFNQQLKSYRELGKQWGIEEIAVPMVSPDELGRLDRLALELAAKLEASSQADAGLVEEKQAVEQRHRFLVDQISDLEGACRDLSKVIGQLDGLISQKFEAAFGAIAESFNANFQKLFEGGQASLNLSRDEAGYGIEITANPPGKRSTSLATLSGGERALTGIAMLMAILTVNPSPFVVLDEVDAALDEANSARFAEVVGQTESSTQFIVITHNRQTMTAAHSLFGVTMSQDNVSNLLSMKLEEAKQAAAR